MRYATAALLVAAALLAPGCKKETPAVTPAPSAAPGQGDHGDVQRTDLVGEHVCRATGGSTAHFRWTFTETEFTVHTDGSDLAPEVLEALLGRATGSEWKQARQVGGKWALDGKRLALTDVRWFSHEKENPTQGGEPAPDVTLTPIKTPVVRFDFGKTQYVLGPAPR